MLKKLVLLLTFILLILSACGTHEPIRRLENVFRPELLASEKEANLYADSMQYYDNALYLLRYAPTAGMFLRRIGMDGAVTEELLCADDGTEFVQSFTVTPDGIVMAAAVPAGNGSGLDYVIVAADGRRISTSFTEVPSHLFMDDAGNLWAAGGSRICMFSPDGTEQLSLTTDGEILAIGGNPVLFAEKTETGIRLMSASDTGDVSPVTLPRTSGNIERILFGGGFRCCFDDGEMLHGVDDSGNAVPLIHWENSGISPAVIDNLAVVDSSTLLYYRFNSAVGQDQFVRLTRVPDGEAAPKTVVTLAVTNIANGLQERIDTFNQTNGLYHLELLDYSPNSGLQDPFGKLRLELAAGNMPDLLQIGKGVDFPSMASQGMFADLYPFLDDDRLLSRDSLIDGVLQAFETDDKLYRLPLTFSLSVPAGKAENFKGTDRWTLDEFLTRAKKEDAVLFFDTRENILASLFSANVGTLLSDPGTAARLLTWAGTLPENPPFELRDENDDNLMYRNNSVLLRCDPIRTYLDYMKLRTAFGDEELTFPGYPSEGHGIYLEAQLNIAMSSRAGNPAGAWEFLRSLTADEFLSDASAFPATVSGFEAFTDIAAGMHYYLREDGVLYASPYESQRSNQQELSLTAADIRCVEDLIASASENPADDVITAILAEEADAFFAGRRSADEAVTILLSRIRNYLAEAE